MLDTDQTPNISGKVILPRVGIKETINNYLNMFKLDNEHYQ